MWDYYSARALAVLDVDRYKEKGPYILGTGLSDYFVSTRYIDSYY